MESKPSEFWKIVLGICILIFIFSLISLPSLYERISGDSIPNRPQREPPIEYQWDVAFMRIIAAVISLVIGINSFNKIRTHT